MEDIQPLEIVDAATGVALVRNGATLVYFLNQFVHECSDALISVFDLFVASTPATELRWAVVNATSEEWRPADASVMQRMRDSMAPTGARKRKFTAFRVNDAGDEAPQYGFTLSDKDKESQDSRTLVQMTFPPSVFDESHVENLCALIEKCTALLAPVCGYCSPGLLPADGRQSEAFERIRGVALRYPGYDVAMNDMTQLDIGSRVRGARWVNLLGPELLGKLGGSAALQKAFPPAIEVRDVAGVAMIRAGRFPEIGDNNRRQGTPLLRAVALVLEPITLFEEVDLLSHFANFDDDLLKRWERRFLD